MIGKPEADGHSDAVRRAQQVFETTCRAVRTAAEHMRGAGIKEWISAISLLLFVVSWLLLRPPSEPKVDLAVTSISFDSVDTWDWTTVGCTVGPRVRVRAHVNNRGNVTMEDGEARVRFVGKSAVGSDAEVLTFEVPIRSIGTSRRTDDVTDGATVTLPEAFLTRQSYWTATIIQPEDVNPRNDTVSGQVLNPCRRRAEAPYVARQR